MENKPVVPGPNVLTLEEKQDREYERAVRDVRISRARANVVRGQIVEAYRVLDAIRFDHLGDTAFREKIVEAKSALEFALGDFLMSEAYWDRRCKYLWDMTPKEFFESKVLPLNESKTK